MANAFADKREIAMHRIRSIDAVNVGSTRDLISLKNDSLRASSHTTPWLTRFVRRLVSCLRRRNTRYKSPQLAAQRCFVASFGSMFRVFSRDQLVAQQKRHFLRVEEIQLADWLICLVRWIQDVASLRKNEQQSQNLSLKVFYFFARCFSRCTPQLTERLWTPTLNAWKRPATSRCSHQSSAAEWQR